MTPIWSRRGGKLSKENNEIWVETMLRLGYNTVESQSLTDYSRPYAVNADARLFEKYGMRISFTHTVSLNSHYSRWDDYWTRIRGQEGSGTAPGQPGRP
jgi:hypothetical protein